MKNQYELKNEKIGRLLLKYSLPAILSMMVTSLYNTVDRAFIGSIKDIGALAISGLGVTMPLFTILGAFCVAISVGGSTKNIRKYFYIIHSCCFNYYDLWIFIFRKNTIFFWGK